VLIAATTAIQLLIVLVVQWLIFLRLLLATKREEREIFSLCLFLGSLSFFLFLFRQGADAKTGSRLPSIGIRILAASDDDA
jgi:hypothetical protein